MRIVVFFVTGLDAISLANVLHLALLNTPLRTGDESKDHGEVHAFLEKLDSLLSAPQ